MYIFNAKLLETLGKEMGVPLRDIATMLDVPVVTLNSWRRKENLKVSRLIDICNALNISVSSFICDASKVQEHIFRPPSFTPIEFRYHELGDDLTVGENRTVEQTVDELGIGLISFYKWFRYDESVIMVKDFLRLCNENNIYPGDYIVDYNQNIPLAKNFRPKREDANHKLEKANQRIQELNKRNKILQAKLEKLKRQLEELTNK